jgi:hypothetical protein
MMTLNWILRSQKEPHTLVLLLGLGSEMEMLWKRVTVHSRRDHLLGYCSDDKDIIDPMTKEKRKF